MRIPRFRGLVILFAVLALVGAACASDEPTTGDGTTSSGDAESGLLEQVRSEGVLRVSTDRRTAASVAQRGDGRVRRLRNRRRNGDRRAAGGRDRMGDPVVGHHHGRWLERPVGCVSGLDDRHHGACRGARLHRALLLHTGRARGAAGQRHRDARRSVGHDGRRLRRMHLRVLPATRPQHRHPGLHLNTSCPRTSRSSPTTPTRPRSSTWRSAASTPR